MAAPRNAAPPSMPPMLTLDALDTRLSVPTRQLTAPGPDDAQFLRMLRTATRVPDHGKRVPFRVLRIAGDTRLALADVAEARLREREAGSPAMAWCRNCGRALPRRHSPSR